MVEIHITDLDKDGFLLNTPGMTIDLRKGMQGGYEPKFTDYITKQTTVCPGDDGKDLWLDALNTFFLREFKRRWQKGKEWPVDTAGLEYTHRR